MKAAEWIDKLKAARGWESDYRVAKELGFKPNTISGYRAHGTPMDEAIAIKVAQALGEKPEAVLLDQFAERVKDQAISTALHRVASSLCILCKVAGAVVKKARISGPGLNSPGFPFHFPPSNLTTA